MRLSQRTTLGGGDNVQSSATLCCRCCASQHGELEYGLAQVPVGSLNGIVHDQSGGVMQGAAVTVTNKDTGQERQVVTAADGSFGVSPLPSWKLHVEGRLRPDSVL